jgi:hypothetical protein
MNGMKSKLVYGLQSKRYNIARLMFEPSAIEPIVGKKRIAEMTADEYLKLATQSQKAMGGRTVRRYPDRQRG